MDLEEQSSGQEKVAKYIMGSVWPLCTGKTPVSHIETCTALLSLYWSTVDGNGGSQRARDRALQRSSLSSGGRIRTDHLRTSELRPTNVGHLRPLVPGG